ncbi:MAG: hypothetical protein K2X27_07030 [Candidatus Obscuribacterales bacterium]|nr:hypothetical protein [Candidatus Obscuribacterales bacterium]
MKIRSLETSKITLPFRFSFGHSLASRAESQNIIVKITLNNGVSGYGEAVPRDYVTGETVDSAETNILLQYAPEIIGMEMDDPSIVRSKLKKTFEGLGLREKAQGASWCALELACLDAVSRLHGVPVWQMLGKKKQDRIRYGGVIPFGKKKALQAVLSFYKVFGYGTVKLKVGAANLEDDLAKLRLARKIMGEKCTIRVDANAAWNLEQALKAAVAFRPYKVASYEQPLAADDWDALKKLSSEIEEDVVLDESLCTLKQAELLAREKICDAFNVRVSKAGGLLPSQEMIDIALKNGLRLHLGAQVGESGILSAAARHLAVVNEPMENYEGAANFLLLKSDICKENLTAGFGGYGSLPNAGKAAGFGITIIDSRLTALSESGADNTTESPESLRQAISPEAS